MKNLTQRRRAHRGFAEKIREGDVEWRFEAQCELTRERIAGNTLLVNYFLSTVRMEREGIERAGVEKLMSGDWRRRISGGKLENLEKW
jgi:hypothetical protein